MGTTKIIDKLDNKLKAITKVCPKCQGTGRRKTPWYNHPAVQMWRGHELALLLYGWYICSEWVHRGYKDSLLIKFCDKIHNILGDKSIWNVIILPKWLGNKKFHNAMKSNLLRKDKKYYSRFGWKVKDNLPYIWGNK